MKPHFMGTCQVPINWRAQSPGLALYPLGSPEGEQLYPLGSLQVWEEREAGTTETQFLKGLTVMVSAGKSEAHTSDHGTGNSG